jgi:tellurite methyltransferase
MTSDDPRERWNRRYRGEPPPTTPSRFVTEHADVLPSSGRVLDVGGGAGRNALWLAARGLEVTLVDVSDEACETASRWAAAAEVDLEIVRSDLEEEAPPEGPWDVIVDHHYLDRDLLRSLPEMLRPGGVALVCQPTVRNLERHDRPSPRWLVEEGELGDLVEGLDGLEVIDLTEDWTEDDRHEARLVARRTT